MATATDDPEHKIHKVYTTLLDDFLQKRNRQTRSISDQAKLAREQVEGWKKKEPPKVGTLGKIFGFPQKVIEAAAAALQKLLDRLLNDSITLYLPAQQLKPCSSFNIPLPPGRPEAGKNVKIFLPWNFRPGDVIQLRSYGRRILFMRGDLFVRLCTEVETKKEKE